MSEEIYKKLYYRAFNRLTDLNEEIKSIQRELEELYLQLNEEEEEKKNRKKGQT